MAAQSKIEWTEQTWNPATGCTKISEGCRNCYAEKMSHRLKAMGLKGYENGFKLTLQPERLDEPLNRKKPTMYFVNSMSDIFHERIPEEYIRRVFEVIRACPQHTFQVLTKRADRMERFFHSYNAPPNAWLGVTVENKKEGVPRIDYLRRIKARVRFLSVEPLLEDLGPVDLSGIQWVIVGGESGPQARPMMPVWAENIQSRCDLYGASFFFKQWGGWGADGKKRAKRANGRLLLGRTWDNMPYSI